MSWLDDGLDGLEAVGDFFEMAVKGLKWAIKNPELVILGTAGTVVAASTLKGASQEYGKQLVQDYMTED